MKKSDIFRKLTAGIKLKKPSAISRSLNQLPQLNNPTAEILESDDSGNVRRLLNIEVEGNDVPDPISSFEEMKKTYDIPEVVMKNLSKAGFIHPTPIQMQATPLMMDRREVICSAPTGSGKTLAFLLPIILQLKSPQSKGFRAIILAPTRELAKQLHREFLWVSDGTELRVHIINDIQKAIKKFDDRLGLKRDILITTPKKLMILLTMDPPILNLKFLRWLVIDECDRLFEPAFREQLAFIYQACSKSKQIRRAMFSATFDDELEQWFKMNLNDVVSLVVGGKNVPTNSVVQSLEYVGNEDGKRYALKNHIIDGLDAPVLIFVDHIEAAKKLFQELITQQVNCDCIHSDRLQSERDKIVKQFREGRIMFLICTELMGRGIDFKHVNTIINYDCPTSIISYIHRIGRTGRGGRVGKAITFYTDKDIVRLRPIAKVMQKAGCPVPGELLKQHHDDPLIRGNKKQNRKRKKKNRKQQSNHKNINSSDAKKFRKDEDDEELSE